METRNFVKNYRIKKTCSLNVFFGYFDNRAPVILKYYIMNIKLIDERSGNMIEYALRTTKADDMINITNVVENEVKKSRVADGVVIVFIPHTTAGVTINENTDPDVVDDMLLGLRNTFPDRTAYKHMEGNSHAHIKASIMGSSCNVIIKNGELVLGTWQGIYFCEFDGPRNRKIYIKVMKD